MRKALTRISALAVAACLSMPAMALADDGPALTLRVEPGVAIPFTSPQTDRFRVGGDLAVKPTIGILPWFDANLTLSALELPSKIDGVSRGEALGVGLGARVKRPHDESNTGTGFSAVSPWVDVDGQFLRTGDLSRFGWSAGVGAAVPTSDARTLWVGPFVRYLDVVDSLNDRPGINSSDAHVLIAGLSFEFGASPVHKAAPPPEVKKEVPPPAVEKKEPPKKEEPKKDPEPVTLTIDTKIQFPFDSAVPLPASSEALATVLQQLLAYPNYDVTIEGHASSEGKVAYNDKLSVRRAQAVADYLTKNGVPADRIMVKGYGSRVPVASNATEAGRVKNRRVEFTVKLTLKKEGTK